MKKSYPVLVMAVCAILVASNLYDLRFSPDKLLTFIQVMLSIVLFGISTTMIPNKIADDETPADPKPVALTITVKNNRNGETFTYKTDNEFGLQYGYGYGKSGEFLKITREDEKYTYNLAVLTKYDIIDIKHGFYKPE